MEKREKQVSGRRRTMSRAARRLALLYNFLRRPNKTKCLNLFKTAVVSFWLCS